MADDDANSRTDASSATEYEIDPVAEDKYWSEAYSASPHLREEWDYKVFQPACRYGWESFGQHGGRKFDEVEPELRAGWDKHRGDSGPNWGTAREAARAAWNRVERASLGPRQNKRKPDL